MCSAVLDPIVPLCRDRKNKKGIRDVLCCERESFATGWSLF